MSKFCFEFRHFYHSSFSFAQFEYIVVEVLTNTDFIIIARVLFGSSGMQLVITCHKTTDLEILCDEKCVHCFTRFLHAAGSLRNAIIKL